MRYPFTVFCFVVPLVTFPLILWATGAWVSLATLTVGFYLAEKLRSRH